jgi:hypothetical protein
MRRYITRACVAAAAGVALSTAGVSGASASRAAPWVRQAVQVSSAGRPVAAASPGAQLWIKSYNGLGNNSDVAKAVAVSPDGKTVYVTGEAGPNGTDYATIGYNAAGGTQQWVSHYNGSSIAPSSVPSAPPREPCSSARQAPATQPRTTTTSRSPIRADPRPSQAANPGQEGHQASGRAGSSPRAPAPPGTWKDAGPRQRPTRPDPRRPKIMATSHGGMACQIPNHRRVSAVHDPEDFSVVLRLSRNCHGSG